MKISIIGCGKVGSTTAFALLYSMKPKEIMLIDREEVKAEELDLGHAAIAISPNTSIRSSIDVAESKNSDFVIITAGKARIAGQTREELAKFNEPIIRSFMQQIIKVAPKAHIIIVTNPSTQMGKIAKEFTSKVTVMDNQLDTARLRYFISKEGFYSPKSEAKGEHGENMQFEFKDDLTEEQKARVSKLTKEAGKEIINGKGYTNWGIASQICETIKKLRNI